MTALPRAATLFVFSALSGVGCLFPSFDGMSGGTSGHTPPPGTDSGLDGASTNDGATRIPGSPDGGGEASIAAPALFNCGFESTRCKLGVEVCCGHIVGDYECRLPGNTDDCDGLAHCGDTADCKGAGEQCCFDKASSLARCKTNCSTSGGAEVVVCDKSKPTCPGTMTCTGWWAIPHCT